MTRRGEPGAISVWPLGEKKKKVARAHCHWRTKVHSGISRTFVFLQSARGLAHSKTLRVSQESSYRARRLGVSTLRSTATPVLRSSPATEDGEDGRRPAAAFRLRTGLPKRCRLSAEEPPGRARWRHPPSILPTKTHHLHLPPCSYPAAGAMTCDLSQLA